MMEKDLAIFNYCAVSSKLHLVFNTLILDQTESDISQAPFSCVLMGGLGGLYFACTDTYLCFCMNTLGLSHKCFGDIQK